MNKFIFLVFFDIFGVMFGHAQSIFPSTLNAAGGYAIQGGNTYEWSFGEPGLVTTYTNSSLIVAQGVLQPTVDPNLLVREQTTTAALQAFPNPTSDYLQLRGDIPSGCLLRYELSDFTGRQILGKTTLGQDFLHEGINLSGLAIGAYLIKIRYTYLGISFDQMIQVQKIN
jgi:hypothetical protein